MVGLLGGDWLRVRRAENLTRIVAKLSERLIARGIETTQPASPSIVQPMLIAAADESRDELQDIWARLLAAAADPARAKSFRLVFIEIAKKMDPLDVAALQLAHQSGGRFTGELKIKLAEQLKATRDEIEVSVGNLLNLRLVSHAADAPVSALGREFVRVISD